MKRSKVDMFLLKHTNITLKESLLFYTLFPVAVVLYFSPIILAVMFLRFIGVF
jgi:hypothetical protein